MLVFAKQPKHWWNQPRGIAPKHPSRRLPVAPCCCGFRVKPCSVLIENLINAWLSIFDCSVGGGSGRGCSAFVYSLFLNEAISSSSGSRTVDNATTPCCNPRGTARRRLVDVSQTRSCLFQFLTTTIINYITLILCHDVHEKHIFQCRPTRRCARNTEQVRVFIVFP